VAHPFDRYAPFTDVTLLKEASERPLRKSIRVNTLKATVEGVQAWGRGHQWELTPVPWCREGFFVERVDREEALGNDLLHRLGYFYIQEAASMLPVELLDPQPNDVILDMSAAPGSKATQIAARFRPASAKATAGEQGYGGQAKGVLVANDVQEKRLWAMKSSFHRLGVTNVLVTKKVGQWFARNMTERFDRVLIDAPCTAQGTSRKDSDALLYSSIDNVLKMAKLQRELLESAVHAAKVGGRIVYSTCTLTPEENEGVVLSILNKFSDQLSVLDPKEILRVNGWNMERAIDDSSRVQHWLLKEHSHPPQRPTSNQRCPMLRLWPHVFDTEGFFCAVLEKHAPTPRDGRTVELAPVRFEEELLPPARVGEIIKFLERQFGTSFLNENDRLFIRTDQLLLTNRGVASFALPVRDYSLGLPFGRYLEGGRVRLSHELVTLRGTMATRGFCEIGEEQLETLLSGKDTTCPLELRGDVILRYRGMSIGLGLGKEGKLKNNLPRWFLSH